MRGVQRGTDAHQVPALVSKQTLHLELLKIPTAFLVLKQKQINKQTKRGKKKEGKTRPPKSIPMGRSGGCRCHSRGRAARAGPGAGRDDPQSPPGAAVRGRRHLGSASAQPLGAWGSHLGVGGTLWGEDWGLVKLIHFDLKNSKWLSCFNSSCLPSTT